jgi:hypothetical protein
LLFLSLFASSFVTAKSRDARIALSVLFFLFAQLVYSDSLFQKNMENVSLSVKEEIADETKYGSSSLHPDIGVLEENSIKVM